MDAATDEEIARILAEEQAAYYGYQDDDIMVGNDGADTDSDYGPSGRKQKKKPRRSQAKKKVTAGASQRPNQRSSNENGHAETRAIDGTAAPVLVRVDAAGSSDVAPGSQQRLDPRMPSEDHQQQLSQAHPGVVVTATGRRKRKDTGQVRNTTSRAWTDEEERLFLEALTMHGRDWKKCADHIQSRDHRAVASHCQKFLIKQLLKGEELPGKMVESGRGYTLSGKPLDPNSAAARAYGLRPEGFQKVVESGFLEVGVHVTTLELTDAPPPRKHCSRSRASDGPTTENTKNATAVTAKRARMFISNAEDTSDVEISSDDEETLKQALADAAAAAAALHPTGATTTATAAAAGAPAGEPTEYVKSRPRRQAATRAHMGSTTESLDLTVLHHFVGPVGGGGALSQPFSVSLSPEAALVMDFHAHLSACEVIGLLGGAFDEETRSLEVKAAFPCRRAAGSDSGTSVELDAESQVEVTTAMAAAGLSPVGWYHSHPVFEPRPSAKDNENQRNYQALCRSERSGLEPWVGAIVGPYDQALPSGASGVQLWVVRQRDRAPVPFNVRANRDRMRDVPLEGDDVETQLMIALEQHREDFARINFADLWRPYTHFVGGCGDGPALRFDTKLAIALQEHLPKTQPEDLRRFFARLQGYFKSLWDVDVDMMSPLAAAQMAAAAGDAVAVAAPMEGFQESSAQTDAERQAQHGSEAHPSTIVVGADIRSMEQDGIQAGAHSALPPDANDTAERSCENRGEHPMVDTVEHDGVAILTTSSNGTDAKATIANGVSNDETALAVDCQQQQDQSMRCENGAALAIEKKSVA